MPVDVPGPGDPILDTWGAAVASIANQVESIRSLIRSTQVDTNNTSLVDWLTFSVVTGRAYWINVSGMYQVDHASSQLQHGYDRPAGDAALYVRQATSGITTEELARLGATGTPTAFANAGATSSQRHFHIWGRYLATASGTFRLQVCRTGTSAGIHVMAGSGGIVVQSA